MGRRKLPSIPAHPSYSSTITYPAPPAGAYSSPSTGAPIIDHTDSLKRTTPPSRRSQLSPAPVYINSSAPLSTTSSNYSLFTSSCTQTSAPCFLPSEGKSLPNGHLTSEYSRPSSASSSASLSRSIDPAIIPGAAFHNVAKSKTAVRQPVSIILKTKTAYKTKIPNTLARVLLKKELKEALARRRESLEACEIEANQRQYVVHKMLITGLLPEAREDDTPKVIPCLLPIELISGARVMPKTTCTVATQKSETDESMERTPSTSTVAKTPLHTKHSVAVQSRDSNIPLPSTRHHIMPSTSLRAQLSTEKRCALSTFGSFKNAETQTELPLTSSSLYNRLGRQERLSRKERFDVSAQTNDLLEATKKYFEDYDRQLKDLTEKAKRRLEFHDDDPLTRETRKMQLMEELARRRERMWANAELPSHSLPYRAPPPQHGLASSDYSSTVPHYGSLPRIDYPSRNRRSPLSRDFTCREPLSTYPYNYGSLPRNYERCLGQGQPLEPIQVDYEQSFGSRPAPYGNQSRSMYDLHSDNIIDPRYRQTGQPINYRSLNYIDQLSSDPERDRLLTFSSPLRSDPYKSTSNLGRSYANDTTNIAGSQMLAGTQSQQTDMISQYANFLNNQFQTGLLTGAADQLPRVSSMPAPMPPLLTKYETPLSDSYTAFQPNAAFAYPSQPYSDLYQPQFDAFPQTYSAPQVYSRNEINYGARPPNYSLDYGNMERLRMLESRTHMNQPIYDIYNQNAAHYGSTMPSAPISILPQYPTNQYQMPLRTSYPPTFAATEPSGYCGNIGPRSWSNGNLVPSDYESRFPREDALSRMYATMGRRRPANNNRSDSLGKLYDKQQLLEKSKHVCDFSPRAAKDRNSGHIKRILLTRRYKDHNIYNDLGIRVVGGKRMPSGELGAFVSAVNQGKYNQTLGEIKEDGKTFEEVERIVNSSKGEVEIILKAEGEKSQRVTHFSKYSTVERYLDRQYDVLPDTQTMLHVRETSPDRAPPVPMHRQNGHLNQLTQIYDNVSGQIDDQTENIGRIGHRIRGQQEPSLGHLQVSISYDRVSSRLIVRIHSARGLKMRDAVRRIPPNPFVKIYLLPGRKVSHKRRTRFVPCNADPEWNQIVEYDMPSSILHSHFIEFSIWDYDKFSENNSLGQVIISLAGEY
uniref:C2 domain-containing protein n=1 Tax=Heterorhabditis bacteriophora TaxID=37862 RepID=A0A1I7WN05_HETBA